MEINQPIFPNFSRPNRQTKLNGEKPVSITAILSFPIAITLGYPLGIMYASQKISITVIVLVFLISLFPIQTIFSVVMANCKLEHAGK
ncbi:MAG TPA: hypothetical protein VK400_06460 [Pyrinomonadaceae bacterium]|nr:hypothetical protein [Pyrinomonadaceae bacterium]